MPDWGITAAMIGVAAVAVFLGAKFAARFIRRKLLMRQFQDPHMVDTIMTAQIAQGMTAEMVIASWGEPADMDETVMKTKTKREMKYDQKGKNRFGTRVYLENGIVVGWETK